MSLVTISVLNGLVAQTEVPNIVFEPAEETFLLSSPQFLVALLAGVMMAFGFQLLFTNLSVAFVMAPEVNLNDDVKESESLGSAVRKIETKLGLWTVLTVSLALFIACFLAVKLSLVGNVVLGAITGIVIWSTFFSLLVWLGSTTVGSLVGSVISTATAGLKGVLGSAGTAIGATAAKNQAVATAEEITAAVRRELTAGLDADSIRATLQDTVSKLQLPQLNVSEVGERFTKILNEANLSELSSGKGLKNFDRQSLVKLVSSRTDFSKQDVNRIVDQLEQSLKQVANSSKKPGDILIDFLRSATPDQLRAGNLRDTLSALIDQVRQPTPQQEGGVLSNQVLGTGIQAVLGTILDRVDLSDVDVEGILGVLRQLGSRVTGPSNRSSNPFSIIRSDLENYLLLSPPWAFSPEAVKREFKEVIYDAEADPGILRQELDLLNRNYFVELLSLRDDLSSERTQELADFLEQIRLEVFSTVQAAETQSQSENLRDRVVNYLRSMDKAELNPEGIQRDFKTLLEDPDAGVDALRDRLSQFDRDTLTQLLQQRSEFSEDTINQVVSQLEQARNSVLSQAQTLADQAQNRASELRHKVEAYLRNTNREELNPDGIQRDFKTLLDDPQAGVTALRARLAQFDRETLVQLLRQRGDLSEDQINQTLDQLESVRDGILQAPQKLVGKAKEQYDQTMSKIADYFRNTNLEELNPEGIQQDLRILLDDPKLGASALRDRVLQIDRETLVKLLSQRDDLSEEQVNRAIDQVQETLRGIIKAPRRLASRVQKQAISFETNLETYLRNTNKDELNPDGIKRDLQLLIQDPRSGLESLGDRMAQVDRSTFVALLSQRDDITEAEANQIADQVESTFNTLIEPIKKAQQAVSTAVEGALGQLRSYLNSLQRPELNYDSIKQDFRQLFDDPQSGLEALRDRLGHFDRGTLVAILSSREDISEADVNRIIDQVEGVRTSALQRLEQVQTEAQRRIKALRQQAKQQVVETQKVAAGAAWWLFGTALTSLIASASAGAIAVRGLDILG
jgi:ElaB/YqjD/DUF883 family membrane-anchored ribosome-binding protein